MNLGIFKVGVYFNGNTVAFPESDHILDQAVSVKMILDQLRRNIFSVAEDDKVFLPGVEIEISIFIHVAEVAGAEPAVLRDGLRSEFRIIDVAHHDGRTLDLDLTINKTNLASTNRFADRGDFSILP